LINLYFANFGTVIIMALITAVIGFLKRKSFVGWFVFGMIVPVISLISVVMVGSRVKRATSIICPYCMTENHPSATVCKSCTKDIPSSAVKLYLD